MRHFRLIALFALTGLLAACTASRIEERNYFLLTYFPHTENPRLVQKTPIDAAVSVETSEVARPYDRRQVAIRNYGPELQYSNVALWAENFGDAAPRLISRRLDRYGCFREVRPAGSEPVDLRLRTIVNNVEFFRNPDTRQAQAHLDIEFQLVEAASDKILVRYSNSVQSGMIDYDDFSLFVQQVDLLLLQETDRFVVKTLQYYGMMGESPAGITLPASTEGPKLVQDSTATAQQGVLEVPALSGTEDEPYYSITDQYGLELDLHPQMGQSVLLNPGNYSISYGSGNRYQQMQKDNIEIVPMFRTVVEPDWGCLIVDIVDEQRNYHQMQYNVFDAISSADFGIGWSVEDEIGEREKIWVLRPGLYKVTINDEPANTYRDFATVTVEPGKVERLMLVVETDADGNPTSLVGAGVSEAMGELTSNNALKLSSAVHANVNLSSDNSTDRNNPTTKLTVTTELDNRILFDQYPYYFNSKMLFDLNMSKDEDTDFRFSSDNASIKNTFIYYLIHELGLYARADISSQLFTGHKYTETPANYLFIDRDSVQTYRLARDNVQVSPNFLPLKLKEGLGINLRLFNTPSVQFNLRSGFGLRQDFNQDVYVRAGADTLNGQAIEVYRELDNLYSEGVEFSAVSNFLLPGNLTLSSNADALVPMEKGESVTYEWENTVTMKLLRYVSLDYRYNLRYNKEETDYTVQDHTLFLRFTYILY